MSDKLKEQHYLLRDVMRFENAGWKFQLKNDSVRNESRINVYLSDLAKSFVNSEYSDEPISAYSMEEAVGIVRGITYTLFLSNPNHFEVELDDG